MSQPLRNDCICRQTGNNISAARWTFRQLNSDHSGEWKKEYQVMKNTFEIDFFKKNYYFNKLIAFHFKYGS